MSDPYGQPGANPHPQPWQQPGSGQPPAQSLTGGSTDAAQKVDPGSVGGMAECAGVTGIGLTATLCAWTNSEALLGFIFQAYPSSQAQALMRTMLPAIVTVG